MTWRKLRRAKSQSARSACCKSGKLVALIVPAGKQGEQNVERVIREATERVSRRFLRISASPTCPNA